jgi:triphosphatase
VADTALGPLLDERHAASLQPVFKVSVRRTEYRLVRPGAVVVAALDHGTVRAGSRHSPVCELELELLCGRTAALFGIAQTLGNAVPMYLSVKTKADRGYELLKGNRAAPKSQSVAVSPAATAGDAFQTIARSCLRQVIGNAQAVIARDGEALHRMRVALRRLRAAISVFSDVVADPQSAKIRFELGRLERELGPARDLDVFITDVVIPLRQRHRHDRGMNRICRNFKQRRTLLYAQLVGLLQTERFRYLELQVARWIETGAWITSQAGQGSRLRNRSVIGLAAHELARRRKKLKKSGQHMAKLSREKLHKLRIRAKKLRYATEFFSALFPGNKRAERCRETLSALVNLQDSLGALHDLGKQEALYHHGTQKTGWTGGTVTRSGAIAKAVAVHVTPAAQRAHVAQLFQEAKGAFEKFCAVKPFWE